MKSVLNAPNPISLTRAYGINAANPIITRASNQKIGTAQTFGLPGSKQNKTVLGAYRMGSSEESSGAIYPGEIFPPLPPSSRDYPEVTFQTTGNNVYQPEVDDSALYSLLKKYGEQKFKASENEPFAEYFQAQKLAKDIEEASKITGTSDAALGREIIRSVAEFRRKQNMDDYMRKLVDAGLPASEAEVEIANLRKAQALHEAKNVDDRPYQAKMLIHNLAKKKGTISAVNEPLTQTGPIMSPQMNHSVAAAMGVPQDAFGQQPIDASRVPLTPDFYKRFLRRSQLTQDFADQQSAINQMIAEGSVGDFRSPIEMNAAAREKSILDARDAAAARVDVLRNRNRRNIAKLAPIDLFAEDVFKMIYKNGLGNKKPGDEIAYKREDIADMNTMQLLLALNAALYARGEEGIRDAKRFISSKNIGRENMVAPHIKDILRDTVKAVAKSQIIPIPAGTGSNGDIIIATTPDEIKRITWKALSSLLGANEGSSSLMAANAISFLGSIDDAYGPILTMAEAQRAMMERQRSRDEELRAIFADRPSEEQAPPSLSIREVSTRRITPEISARFESLRNMSSGLPAPSGASDSFMQATREKFPKGKRVAMAVKEATPAPATPGRRLEDMTVAQLKDKAKSEGKRGYSNKNKEDLIALLRE